MAILCADYNLLFIMVPRTACTAVGHVLCQQLGGVFLPQQDILNAQGNFHIQKKHSTLEQLLSHGLLTHHQSKELLSFSCVRNPFDSMVSLYIKKHSQYQPLLSDPNSWVYRLPHYTDDMHFCATHSFAEWLIRRSLRTMVKRACLGREGSLYEQFTRGVTHVMRFESLQRDFHDILSKVGIDHVPTIPPRNRTIDRKSDYRSYYSPLTRGMATIAFAQDLKRYEYTFNQGTADVNPT